MENKVKKAEIAGIEKMMINVFKATDKGEACLFVFGDGECLVCKGQEFKIIKSVSQYVDLAKRDKAPLVAVDNSYYFDELLLDDFIAELQRLERIYKN